MGTFMGTWGSGPGVADGQFDFPRGVAVDTLGNVYVADTHNNRIQKFSSTGTFLATWGSAGSGNGEFSGPSGVAWSSLSLGRDQFGTVYVADTGNNRIQSFTSSGTFLRESSPQGLQGPRGVATSAAGNVYVADTDSNRILEFDPNINSRIRTWGSLGLADSQFDHPSGVAVDTLGNVYVADTGNNRIQEFSSTGTFIAKWGSFGSGDGQFKQPRGVAAGTFGNIYVADTGNDRIQKLSPGGAFMTAWGIRGTRPGRFRSPAGVAVDASGRVYVADTGNDRIQAFDPNGRLEFAWGSHGAELGKLVSPTGIAIDCHGDVLVSETANNRLQRFTLPGAGPSTCIVPPAPPPPLSASLGLVRRAGALGRDGVIVQVACNQPCGLRIGGSLGLRARRGPGTRGVVQSLVTVRRSLPAGTATRIGLRLRPPAVRALARALGRFRSLRLTVALLARAANGQVTTSARGLIVYR
jgi:tripartite motif-containing protein 71